MDRVDRHGEIKRVERIDSRHGIDGTNRKGGIDRIERIDSIDRIERKNI